MRFCPFCANELAEDAEQCVFCGKRLPQRVIAEAPPAPVTSAQDAGPTKTMTTATSPPVQVFPPPRPPPAPLFDTTPLPVLAPVPAAEGATDSGLRGLGDEIEVHAPSLQHDELPPIPVDAPPGLVSAARYLLQVTRGRRARARAIRAHEQEWSQVQLAEDAALRQLGRAVRTRGATCPGAEAQMAALLAQEAQHTALQQSKGQLDECLAAARQKLAEVESACQVRMESAREQMERTQQLLDERLSEQASLKTRLAQQERQMRALERERDDRRLSATRVQDPAERETLQRLAAEKGVELGDLQRSKAATQSEQQQLQQPIVELRTALQQHRTAVQEAERTLAAAQDELVGEKARVEQEKQRIDLQQGDVDRQTSAHLTELGRVVDRLRQDNDDLQPMFARIDEHRQTARQLRRQIEQLQHQRQSFDTLAYRRGQLLLGGLMLLVLVAGTLMVVLV